ncbi:MAG: sulfate ABC transporter permease subunit CysT, partial [Coriobacteriales bacterium]|nr:sulfate ABC transporter permease subunit CysT [Coriobacteriales bacterium]
WGTTASVLGILVILPIAALAATTRELGISGIIAEVSDPTALAALALSFGGAALTAALNTVMGLLVAWALVRYEFPGRSIADAAVDLPFAMPTAVAGITLAQLFSPAGWLGSLGTRIAEAIGLPDGSLDWLNLTASYTRWGVLIAMTFVSIPFVIRCVQPVLHALECEVEEAGRSLGARAHQVFLHVVLPSLRPALLAGFALSFARSLGEFGSVVVISGNLPMKTLTAPVLIFQKIEQYDAPGASAVAIVMLATSLVVLVGVTLLQGWGRESRG